MLQTFDERNRDLLVNVGGELILDVALLEEPAYTVAMRWMRALTAVGTVISG